MIASEPAKSEQRKAAASDIVGRMDMPSFINFANELQFAAFYSVAVRNKAKGVIDQYTWEERSQQIPQEVWDVYGRYNGRNDQIYRFELYDIVRDGIPKRWGGLPYLMIGLDG